MSPPAEFRDPFWPAGWDQYESSAVVQPDGVEQIQAILRIANEHGVPIWTVSTGRNNGLGGGSPRVKGSIVVNLRRMNRILEINPDMAYAVVEPGVTWNDLGEALAAGGHRLMASITDLGWGSVIGNSLEHGTTYMPYGARTSWRPAGWRSSSPTARSCAPAWARCPTARPGTSTSVDSGPTLDPLFMQSNFGVVVKMGVWLMPFPETYAPFWANFAKETDLIQVMDTMRALRLDRTIEGVPVMYNTVEMACMQGQRTRWYNGDGPTPDHVIDQMAGDLGIGRWTMHGALWDDKVVSDYKIEKITAAFSQIDGARVEFSQYSPDEIPSLPHPADRVLGGAPNLAFLEVLGWYGKVAQGRAHRHRHGGAARGQGGLRAAHAAADRDRDAASAWTTWPRRS